MKNYLSREERRLATFFCIMYGLIETVMQYKENISKEEVTELKYTNTHLGKYITALANRVGSDEGKRLHKEALSHRVELVPKSFDGQFIVDKEALEGALLYAVKGTCDKCTHGVDYYNTCDLYKCMAKLGMGSNSKHEDKCEFNYTD